MLEKAKSEAAVTWYVRAVSISPRLFEILEASLDEASSHPIDPSSLLRRLKELPRAKEALLLAASQHVFALAAERLATVQSSASPELTARVWQWLQVTSGVLVSLAEHHAADSATRASTSEAYFSPGLACRDAIRDAIDGATRHLDVCVFTITDDYLAKALAAAHRRGVAIRIITDNDKGHDAGSDIDRLESLGISVRIDRTEYHMHHKFAIVDKHTLLNGSYNWTRGAFTYNQENVVVSRDPTLLAAFQRAFDELWQQFLS